MRGGCEEGALLTLASAARTVPQESSSRGVEGLERDNAAAAKAPRIVSRHMGARRPAPGKRRLAGDLSARTPSSGRQAAGRQAGSQPASQPPRGRGQAGRWPRAHVRLVIGLPAIGRPNAEIPRPGPPRPPPRLCDERKTTRQIFVHIYTPVEDSRESSPTCCSTGGPTQCCLARR